MKWKEDLLIDIWEMAKRGDSLNAIAAKLGVSSTTFDYWRETKPCVVNTLNRARKCGPGKGRQDEQTETFLEYVYKQLPQHLQDVWVELHSLEIQPNGLRRIEALLKEQGKQTLQYLFLYALVDRNFNASEACSVLHLNYKTFLKWQREDPDFAAIIDEIHLHKKNFFDEYLVRLVKAGDSPAIIFANKTMNRDRYPDKVSVEVEQTVTHKVEVLHIHQLDLPLEVKRLVLEAIRKQKQNTIEGKVVNGSQSNGSNGTRDDGD